jgi:hypothetical protein
MKQHPSDAELALYAGGDQGWLSRKLTSRHLQQCETCQAAMMEFSGLRSGADKFPAVSWNRLASEMTANISLGLAAGECVSMRPLGRVHHPWTATAAGSWRRLALATAILCALGGVGYMVQHPPAGLLGQADRAAAASTVLEASDSGLQIRDGGQTLRLLNTSGKDVTHSVGARGEVGARYLDSNGYVTISQVYGQ